VPEISRFYGIVIYLHHGDHGPPHFHAVYAESEASIAIASVAILEGSLPRRAWRLVREWALRHRGELIEDWELMNLGQQPRRVDPLP
jgi:hypothetical protein